MFAINRFWFEKAGLGPNSLTSMTDDEEAGPTPGLDGLMVCRWKCVSFSFQHPSPSTQELCSPDRQDGESWQQLWAKPGGRDEAD